MKKMMNNKPTKPRRGEMIIDDEIFATMNNKPTTKPRRGDRIIELNINKPNKPRRGEMIIDDEMIVNLKLNTTKNFYLYG